MFDDNTLKALGIMLALYLFARWLSSDNTHKEGR